MLSQLPTYSAAAPAGPFAWDPDSEDLFAQLVAMRLSVNTPAHRVKGRAWRRSPL